MTTPFRAARCLLAVGLLGLGSLPAARAQVGLTRPADDSIRDRIFDRRRLVLQIDSRFSIINYHFCTINGLKVGLELPGRMRTGAAFYFLSSRIPTRLDVPDDAAVGTAATLRFYNIALYGEYVVIENPRWELGANLQGGLGSVQVDYINKDGDRDRSDRDFVGLIEPSAAAQMRLFSWVSLGAGAGWRQAMFVAQLERREISGPIFYARAKILIGPILRIKRQHKPLFSQEGLRVHGLDNHTRQKFLR